MKQGDLVTLTIRDVGMNGEGIAGHEDGTVFVPFALPGEVVEARITYVRRGLAYADLVRVCTPSPHRVEPPCRRYMRCGGCDLMHADYAYQLQCKTRLVGTTLSKAGVLCEVEDCVPSPKPLGYRNKIMLPFGKVEGRTALGFYREGTHRLVSVRHCPLHGEWADRLIALTLRFAEAHDLSVYDSATGRGLLRHLVARRLAEHIDVTVVVNGAELPHWREYARLLADEMAPFALYVSPNMRRNNVIMGDSVHLLDGTPYTYTVGGVAFSVNPLSFLQVNDDVCALIYGAVRNAIRPHAGKVVVDAFAGVGLTGADMARRGADVYNIDIVPEAIADADRLYADNGLAAHNLCGDSAVLLPEVLDAIRDHAPTVHDMHLLRPYFDCIAEGRKTYELRLADDKRRAIRVGDLIRFDCEGDKLFCRVTSTAVYPDFRALFASLGTARTMAAEADIDAAAASMNEIYTPEKQAQYGAMAIGIEPVNLEGLSVVLDPPRKGCPAEVVQTLVRMADTDFGASVSLRHDQWPSVTLPYVEQIVYVSCNPATLARDLSQLQAAYSIRRVTPYDMFPMTRHVETLVQLSHKIPDSHIVVKVDFDKDNRGSKRIPC